MTDFSAELLEPGLNESEWRGKWDIDREPEYFDGQNLHAGER
jgi:hypothetical protein